jgi:DNA-binding LytR/AlgR family response regulator
MDSESIRVLLVEDEFITIETLARTLTDMNYEISGQARNVTDALDILDRNDTDFAILDIQIQGEKDGIWLAGKIREKYDIPFIFITAFGDKTTVKRAMEAAPYGYLVKPFNKVDVFTSIEVALNNFALRGNSSASIQSTDGEPKPLLIKDTVYIRDGYLYTKLNLNDILFVQSGKNYVEVNVKGKTHLVRSSLKEFCAILPDNLFVQVHRSYYVNLSVIDKIGPNFLKIDKMEVPVSSSFKDELSNRLTLF